MRNSTTSVMKSFAGRFGRFKRALPISVFFIFFLVACSSASIPPDPNSIGGVVEGAGYLLIDWQDGQRILIWDDIPNGNHGAASSSSTSSPPFQQEGSAQSGDGRHYEYSLESIDGQQVDLTIDGVPYDLEQGKLFLVHTAGGVTQIEQLDLDLASLSPTNEGIIEFGRLIPEIAAMIAGPDLVTPTPSTAGSTADLTPTAWDEELQTASALDASPESATTEEATAAPPDPDPVQADAHPLAGMVYSTDDGLWIIDRGGESQLIIDQPNARLSPDGRHAVFQPEYDPDIWLADLNTGERLNLTGSSGRFNADPQWWPGQQDLIIFGSSEELGPGYGYPTTVRTDGRDYRILDQEAGGPLALSPDGQKLAYGSFAQAGKIYHWDGETETFDPADYGLSVEKIFQPAWSPDGRQLAWEVSGNPDTSGWSLGFAVFDLEAKTAKLFHTFTPMGGGSFPHYLSWSPSGEWLAFVTFNEPGEGARLPILWITQPDGQGGTRLGPAVDPVWSPDGQRLAYTGFDDSQSANVAWTYDTVTGEQIQVLPASSQVVQWLPPAVAPSQN